MPALFAICHGKWGSRGLCHGLTGKKKWHGEVDRGWGLQAAWVGQERRAEKANSAEIQRSLKITVLLWELYRCKKNLNHTYIYKKRPISFICSWVLICFVSLLPSLLCSHIIHWRVQVMTWHPSSVHYHSIRDTKCMTTCKGDNCAWWWYDLSSRCWWNEVSWWHFSSH